MSLIDELRQRKTYLTTPETMALLAYSRNTLCLKVRSGHIPALRCGSAKYLFDPGSIADWLEARATTTSKKPTRQSVDVTTQRRAA